MLQFAVLASGSEANTFFVRAGNTSILIDAGLPIRQVRERLRLIGEDIMNVSAVCISHEHIDHSRSLRAYVNDFHLPVYCSAGTRDALIQRPDLKLPSIARDNREPEWRTIARDSVVAIGDCRIAAFPVPHDAADSTGFYIKHGSRSVAIATDLGWISDDVAYWLLESDLAFLESNHDIDRLLACDYHVAQKARINQWHLSNDQAFELIDKSPKSTRFILGHISTRSNSLDLIEKRRQNRANVKAIPPAEASPLFTV